MGEAVAQLDQSPSINAVKKHQQRSLELTSDEIAKTKKEIKKYKECFIDVSFNYLNLYRLKDDFVTAYNIAKEHTQVSKEVFSKLDKHYTYALLIQAQCMSRVKNVDHRDTLEVINEAL